MLPLATKTKATRVACVAFGYKNQGNTRQQVGGTRSLNKTTRYTTLCEATLALEGKFL